MIKDEILRLLIKSKQGYVSGAGLAKRFRLTRSAIWKHIKILAKEGYSIEAAPSKGYRLMGIPDIISIADMERALKTKLVGRKIELLAETESTNILAMEAAARGAPEGTVIVAETQTAGKGRLGRQWVSPRGNIYMSIILRPPFPPHKAPLVTLMAAVAAASAIRKYTGLRAEIKWPNDIFIGDKKLGGILTEMSAEPDRVRHIVLGIGINVNMDMSFLPQDVAEAATSLMKEKSERIDRTGLLIELLRELDKWYDVLLKKEALVLDEWNGMNMTIGRRVVAAGLSEKIEGVAHGIDHEGKLIIRLDDGSLRTVAAGDVTIVKK